MGVEVTLVEAMDRILPVEDAEISDFVQKAFAKRGMKIMTRARLKASRPARAVSASFEGDEPTSMPNVPFWLSASPAIQKILGLMAPP